MNIGSIVGYVLFIGMILSAIVIDTPLHVFLDLPSILIVVGITLGTVLIGGREHVLSMNTHGYLWALVSVALVFSGLSGVLIGAIKMLHTLSDPASIGPAMAICLLTSLYACILIAVCSAPNTDRYVLQTNRYEDWDISRGLILFFPFLVILATLLVFMILFTTLP